MVQQFQATRALNPRLINALRHSPHPVHASVLGDLYTDPAHLESDLRVLTMKGMVAQTEGGITWAGT